MFGILFSCKGSNKEDAFITFGVSQEAGGSITATVNGKSITNRSMVEEIKVKVNKEHLNEQETVVKLSIPPVEGQYKPWRQLVTIRRKDAPFHTR